MQQIISFQKKYISIHFEQFVEDEEHTVGQHFVQECKLKGTGEVAKVAKLNTRSIIRCMRGWRLRREGSVLTPKGNSNVLFVA